MNSSALGGAPHLQTSTAASRAGSTPPSGGDSHSSPTTHADDSGIAPGTDALRTRSKLCDGSEGVPRAA